MPSSKPKRILRISAARREVYQDGFKFFMQQGLGSHRDGVKLRSSGINPKAWSPRRCLPPATPRKLPPGIFLNMMNFFHVYSSPEISSASGSRPLLQ